MPEGQVLEFTRVTKRFNDVTAVSDFSARVEPGVVTAFLGPNGAGKTTTLRILLGQLRPTSGTATIGGVAYAELRQPLRTIGAVLEETPYRPRRTANRQLTIAAKANGIPLSRIDEVLTMVGLAGEGDTRLGGYSLGMRQRLNVATALLGDPGALVFDEPANGLDPEGIRWMRLLMRRLADEGRTVLVSSHVLSEVEQVADNVLVLSKGQLVLASDIEKLADPAAGSVVVDADDRAALTAALSAAGFDVEVLRSGLTVRGGDAATVGAVAAAAGIALSTLVQRGPTLEDVFIDLVRGGTLEPRAEAVASQLVDQERNGALAVAPVADAVELAPEELDDDLEADDDRESDAASTADYAPVASPVAAGVATAGAAGLFGAAVTDQASDDESAADDAAADSSGGVAGLFGNAVPEQDAAADVDSDESGSGEALTGEVGSDEAGADETGSDETGSDETRSDEAGSDEAGSDEAGSDEAGSDEVRSNESGSDEVRSDESGSDDAGMDETGSEETGTDQAGSDDAGSDDAGAGDVATTDAESYATDAAEPEAPAGTGIEWHTAAVDVASASADSETEPAAADATGAGIEEAPETGASETGASDEDADAASEPSFDEILFGAAAPVSAAAATAAFSPVVVSDESGSDETAPEETAPEAADAADGDEEPAVDGRADAGQESGTTDEEPIEASAESEAQTGGQSDADDSDSEHAGIEIFAGLGDEHDESSDDHGDETSDEHDETSDEHSEASDEHGRSSDDEHAESADDHSVDAAALSGHEETENGEGGASDLDPRSAAVSSMLAAAARAYYEDEPKDYPLSPVAADSEGENVERAHWSVASTGLIDTVPLAGAEGESPDDEAEPSETSETSDTSDTSDDENAEPHGDESQGDAHDHEHVQHGEHNGDHDHDHHGDEHHHHHD